MPLTYLFFSPPGNCLFNALSDQLHDTQSHHAEIRNRVISYMRDHADYYKQYITVYAGGGVRRNPKRTNTSFSASQESGPTDEEIDTAFEQHLSRMARGGTWGDNIEIAAFGQAYDVDVCIYTRTSEQLIPASQEDMGTKPVVHIAHHDWEHFSSIRNLDGPHAGQGVPDIKPKTLTPEEQARQQHRVANAPLVQPWMIDHVFTALSGLASKKAITHELHKQGGHMDRTVSALLDDHSSASSATSTSNPTTDHDSYGSSHTTPLSGNDNSSSTSSPHSLPTQPSDESASDSYNHKNYPRHPTTPTATTTSTTASSTHYAPSNATHTQHQQHHPDHLTADFSSASRSTSPAKNKPKRFRLLGPRPPGGSPKPAITATAVGKKRSTPARASPKVEVRSVAGSGVVGNGSRSRSQSPSARLLAPRHRGRVEKREVGANGGAGGSGVVSGVGGLEL